MTNYVKTLEKRLKDKESEIERLLIALHDSIRSACVVPDSAQPFYEPDRFFGGGE